LIAGCSTQPESLTTCLISTGAPHSGQVGDDGSLGCRQYRQMYWFIVVSVRGLIARLVVDVSGLDADPARPGHLRHVDVAHQADLDRERDRLHVDRGVLVQEAARLDHDLLAGP